MNEGKVAIVTAASSGMGLAIAKRLADDGFRLALLSRSEAILEVGAQLGGIAFQGSVLEPRDVENLVEQTMQSYGRIDALMANMGHAPKGSLLELSDDDWRQGFENNMLSVIRLARLVTPHLIAGGGGAILNMSAYSAFEPESVFPMSTLRAGLGAWTKLYADLYAAQNIRMNAILPGFMENFPETEERRSRIPMGRYGTMQEIAVAAAFLLTDAAGYITGQCIRVDGGLTRSVP